MPDRTDELNSHAPNSDASSQRMASPSARGRSVAIFAAGILTTLLVIGAYHLLSAGKGEETVRVTAFSPNDEVPLTTNFTVTFSRALVADSLLNLLTGEGPVTFAPPLPGKFEWIARDKLRFYPDVQLAPSTGYVARISAKALAGFGYPYKGQTEFKFSTPRFRVASAHLNFEFGEGTAQAASLYASVQFNYDVDPQVAADAMKIRYKGGENVPFKLLTQEQGSYVSVQTDPLPRGVEEKYLQLEIKKGLKCIDGSLGLERDYIEPAVLPGQEDLKVEQVTPIRVGKSEVFIRVQFNLPVNAQTAGQFITVEPRLDYQLVATHDYLDLIGAFAPDSAYKLSLKSGLRALDGSPLKRDFTETISFARESIPPQIDFVGEGYFLTKGGNLNIGLSTINVDRVSVEVEKVYANNLVSLLNSVDPSGSRWYQHRINRRALGILVDTLEVTVPPNPNEEVITPIDVRRFLEGEDQKTGIFKVTARLTTDRWQMASKWFVATDLGILAKKSGGDMWVWVNSLTTLAPVKQAEITLFSQNNQILVTARTDKNGLAILKDYAALAAGSEPYLLTASGGGDLAFLELTRRMIATSDFEVDGRALPATGYEAYVYGERGVYRPGETAHIAAVVRGGDLKVPRPFPIKLTVTGPDEKIVSEQKGVLNEQGAVEFSVALAEYYLTGKYLAVVTIGEKDEIGRATFNVEEFVPDRMKVRLTTAGESYLVGQTLQIQTEAVSLFGPPAAGRRVSGEIDIEAFPFAPKPWKNFTFADYSKTFTKQSFRLGEEQLDEQGRHVYKFDIPVTFDPPSALRGVIATTVLEPGGRGVTAYRAVTIHPRVSYVGLRSAKEGYSAPDHPTEFEFVVVDTAGTALANSKVEVTFYRIYWHTILKQDLRDGRYRYVSEEAVELISTTEAQSGNDIGKITVKPADYGRYRVVAKDKNSGASASLEFYASGWGYSPWAMDHPDRIELDLDQPTYLPGQVARLQVRAPFAGKLLVTIEQDELRDYQVVTLKENTATLSLPVKESYQPNAYISAHLIRSTESLERDAPVRAFGVVPLLLDNGAHRLTVSLTAPEQIRPLTKLTVGFQIQGRGHRPPYLTITAVDEGICQLTDFQTPDLFGFFLGKRRLGIESFDMYGMVLPEIAAKKSSTGGDVEARRKRVLSPVSMLRAKPVAFWSGLVKADSLGQGRISFDIPQFNGSVRLMAVAFADDLFGMAQENVVVREPIVVTPTFPRFVTNGDEFVVPVTLFNGTGARNSFEVRLESAGPVASTTKVVELTDVPDGKEQEAAFAFKALEGMGRVDFKLSATGGGEKSEMTETVPLRPPVPFTTLSGSGALDSTAAGAFEFPADFVPGTTDFALTISAFPSIRYAGSLQFLLRYPHGCIEQTTSRIFPMLYFKDLAKSIEPELLKGTSADYYIAEGIAKLENMQLPSGAFVYWPSGDYVNNWSSVYAAHFLVEARKSGYEVSDRVYKKMLQALRSLTREHNRDNRYGYQVAAYACYVLAAAGEPERSTMLFLKNSALDKLAGYSQYQLAGAFALSGDLQTARGLLPSMPPEPVGEDYESGGNFNSHVRADAIMLDILAEVDPRNPAVPLLAERLARAARPGGCWYTTQENAYALLALGKTLRQQGESNYTGTLAVEGEAPVRFDTKDHRFTSKGWAGKHVTIEVSGQGTCYYYWRADGLPSSRRVDEYDHDLVVRRRYLDESGSPLNYDSLHQGQMVIAEITVKAPNSSLENVAVVDLLPAGLEIENPRLQSRQGISWIGPRAYQPQNLDLRDDRMIMYGSFAQGYEYKFYYGLRAVTQGTFFLPPIHGEAMYAPMKSSNASSGWIRVLPE